MRTIIISGRIASEAKIKKSQNDIEYVEFRIANNEIADKNKNDGNATYWFRVISFDSRIINISKYITKGKPLNVTGRYSDEVGINKNGKIRINREIIASIIDFEVGGSDFKSKTETKVSPTLTSQMECSHQYCP